MDSWSYVRNGFLANETTLLPCDSFAENRRSIPGFEQGLSTELETSNGFITKVASSSSCAVPLNLEGNQSSNMSRIDYKLWSVMGYGNHDVPSSLPAKKTRASNSCSQSPLCQVYGCNMDLSFSKDYHKRHRVCEAHSKTSVVIVSGVEQRFCQQCSRFHFLSEFDDGKRSCRRRLAGHNERRRKPSFYFLHGKRHKLLPQESFPGSASRLVSFKDEPWQNRICESKPAMEASGVSYIWDLQEAVPRSTCALSLLSAQHLSETPTKRFSITQPNLNLNHSTVDYCIDPSKKTKPGSCSSTVDLLKLSSHLQRIEKQQRTVKHEYNELEFP